MRRLSSLLAAILLAAATAVAQTDAELRAAGLPLLTITTTDSIMPTADIAYPPTEGWGVSITNNAYVDGRMVITLADDTLYDSGPYVRGISGMRIKRRGNSTGANLKQHPYKLKLQKKHDLLRRGDDTGAHKEWLLLSMYTWNVKMTHAESNTINVAGLLVSQIVGKEWTPAYEFVNVVLNGEYQGMYYLMEAVARGDGRVDVEKNGFIIEDDPFWWNEDRYFRTDRQGQRNAYTYKYPDSDDVNDSIQQAVSSYMAALEEKLCQSDVSLEQDIDYESFARWLLIHDILGSDDNVGCNRFLSKRSLTARQSHATRLKTGPVWDYDSSFRSNKGWSHLHSYFYFPYLFRRADFADVYRAEWERVSPILLDRFCIGIDSVWQKYGAIFDQNMRLHRRVYPGEGKNTFRYQLDELQQRMQERVAVMDSLMGTTSPSAVASTAAAAPRLVDIVGLHGAIYPPSALSALPRGIYILRYSDGRARKTVIR